MGCESWWGVNGWSLDGVGFLISNDEGKSGCSEACGSVFLEKPKKNVDAVRTPARWLDGLPLFWLVYQKKPSHRFVSWGSSEFLNRRLDSDVDGVRRTLECFGGLHLPSSNAAENFACFCTPSWLELPWRQVKSHVIARSVVGQNKDFLKVKQKPRKMVFVFWNHAVQWFEGDRIISFRTAWKSQWLSWPNASLCTGNEPLVSHGLLKCTVSRFVITWALDFLSEKRNTCLSVNQVSLTTFPGFVKPASNNSFSTFTVSTHSFFKR